MNREWLLNILCILFSILIPQSEVFPQPATPQKKTKVMILGMFHFASNADRIKMKLDDMMSEHRQKEIEELNQSLLNYTPDKIFIEWEPERQQWVDSLYDEYRKGTFALKANEVYQIGFRLANMLSLPTVYCIDAPGNYLYDTLISTAKKYGKYDRFAKFIDSVTAFVMHQDSVNKYLSVKERLQKVNSAEEIMLSHILNAGVPVAPYLGEAGEYAGAEFMGEWYKRNIRMYSNAVRLTSPSDTAVLIIVGAGHARILKHLFEDNPAFEVVDTMQYLK